MTDAGCLGVLYPAHNDPAQLAEFAAAVEALGFEHLWLAEDCFLSGGFATAATALAASRALTVGVGLLPALARNPAICAMEIGALARIYPGRFTAAFGHGVESWMRQIHARPQDRLAALAETVSAVSRLLGGELVSADGAYVKLADVALESPPATPPPIMVGSTGPRGLAIAGRHAAGALLPEGCTPAFVEWARSQMEAASAPARRRLRCVAYCWLAIEDDIDGACERLRPQLQQWLRADLFPGPKRWAGVPMQPGPPHPDIQTLAERTCICGTAVDCAAAVRRFLDAGVDTLVLNPAGEEPLSQLDRFAAEARPLLGSA